MLKINSVTKYYGDFKAVDNLTFEVHPGEIFGLLGVNGAGKTTTFRMIMGLLEPSSGIITYNDKKIDYDITDKIGFLTEERSLLTKLSVTEQLIYYGSLKGMTESKIIEKMNYWLDRFGISDYHNRKIKELSKGNQQKIQFISAIINDPEILILDEPFTGLDPLNVELFKEVIMEFKDKGSMIIFSSHRMEHVELFCEKLLILMRGKDVLSGNLSDIKKQYRKKNIVVKGKITIKEVKEISGVVDAKKSGDEYIIKISSDKNVKEVFNYISKQDNIIKFEVQEPTLNEIFIAKVGESYEK